MCLCVRVFFLLDDTVVDGVDCFCCFCWSMLILIMGILGVWTAYLTHSSYFLICLWSARSKESEGDVFVVGVVLLLGVSCCNYFISQSANK